MIQKFGSSWVRCLWIQKSFEDEWESITTILGNKNSFEFYWAGVAKCK